VVPVLARPLLQPSRRAVVGSAQPSTVTAMGTMGVMGAVGVFLSHHGLPHSKMIKSS